MLENIILLIILTVVLYVIILFLLKVYLVFLYSNDGVSFVKLGNVCLPFGKSFSFKGFKETVTGIELYFRFSKVKPETLDEVDKTIGLLIKTQDEICFKVTESFANSEFYNFKNYSPELTIALLLSKSLREERFPNFNLDINAVNFILNQIANECVKPENMEKLLIGFDIRVDVISRMCAIAFTLVKNGAQNHTSEVIRDEVKTVISYWEIHEGVF